MPTKRKSSSSSKNKTDFSKPSTSKKKLKIIKEAVESPTRSSKRKLSDNNKEEEEEVAEVIETPDSELTGEPVPDDEARRRWPHRYLNSNEIKVTVHSKGSEPPKVYVQAKRHFTEALVDGHVHFSLEDDGYVYAGEGVESFICRIVEMFEAVDGVPYFCAQWFYRAKDTVIKDCSYLIDDKRIFLSEIKDDNELHCLLEKLKIVRVPLDVNKETKREMLSDGNYYYDMMYEVPFSSYQKLPELRVPAELPIDNQADGNKSRTAISLDSASSMLATLSDKKTEMTLLDLYSGCGGMSTGLCLGANLGNVNLVTKWAIDYNEHACDSLKLNHPETQVRNESAENFLSLVKEWEMLCRSYSLLGSGPGGDTQLNRNDLSVELDETENEEEKENDDGDLGEGVYEVEDIVSIRYGDPNGSAKSGVHLKIRWKNYGPEDDTWQPINELADCKQKIKQFVLDGFKSKILPLPGDVDVVCGGPPCQGISGLNRFRNTKKPLDDKRNQQLVVYMNIVEYLKPRFVLMENVVDILRFSKGFLGRYALGRLVSLNYQARIGLMTAGCYGLPQFRMRMFMWGLKPNEKLPQYPLPTHNVISRGAAPVEFESNNVVYDDVDGVELEKKLILGDAISDLPPVTNDEKRDRIPYGEMPKTEFQKFIRLKKHDMGVADHLLFDHLPYECNTDDIERVCNIPKQKGANFRNLPGVIVFDDNHVELDLNVPRELLPSGNPLVPNYAISFNKGKSSKPFGRIWWDETVSTVVTRPEPHNQIILHPEQDRVLTVRENARLQGFPDYYKLLGPIKERYMQVGNAVAVPVARALGYSLAMSCKGIVSEGPLLCLPKNFPIVEENQ